MNALAASFAETKEIFAANIFGNQMPSPSIQTALAMGAVAAVMQNPEVDRRRLFSWFSSQ